jgi:hypothetical protein
MARTFIKPSELKNEPENRDNCPAFVDFNVKRPRFSGHGEKRGYSGMPPLWQAWDRDLPWRPPNLHIRNSHIKLAPA